VSATRREAERALRGGDVTLAIELLAVADAVELSELRRAESLELRRLLQPELSSGCDCDCEDFRRSLTAAPLKLRRQLLLFAVNQEFPPFTNGGPIEA